MALIEWATFTDSDKRSSRDMHATFVLAPRELSKARTTQLLKDLLASTHVIFGISQEDYVAGFEQQPQFAMLRPEDVLPFEQKVSSARSSHSLTVLIYPQSQVDEVIRAIRPARVIVVRGSYQHAFHRRSTHALLNKRAIPYELVSPFCDEDEAVEYLKRVETLLPDFKQNTGDETVMFQVADVIAKRSFDYSFQTGVVLAARQNDGSYTAIDAASNEVVPYQTYALHHGNAREMHESSFQDTTHYDTIHAEMNLLVRAMRMGHSLAGKALFINLLPCPHCARVLAKTGIVELVYRTEHSGGYAVELFKKTGIKTRKLTEKELTI